MRIYEDIRNWSQEELFEMYERAVEEGKYDGWWEL